MGLVFWAIAALLGAGRSEAACGGSTVTVGADLSQAYTTCDGGTLFVHMRGASGSDFVIPSGGTVATWRCKHGAYTVGTFTVTFTIWRLSSGTTYSCVGTNAGNLSQAAGTDTFTIGSPIAVLLNDVIGLQYTLITCGTTEPSLFRAPGGTNNMFIADSNAASCGTFNMSSSGGGYPGINCDLCEYTPTVTPTVTVTGTNTATATVTATPTVSGTNTVTATATSTASATHETGCCWKPYQPPAEVLVWR